ncbi:MAG: hypothetical protein HY752_03720 [Nitrospirae bacterium]|nr:hypothetical protein [Nitrospirota bacterium]
MIALVIVGITLVVIIHTVNYHADVSFGHNITTRMFLLAREKIADMEINPKNEKGMFYDKDFSYETTVRDTEEDGIVELKAIVRGYGKEVALNEFAAKKEIKNAE